MATYTWPGAADKAFMPRQARWRAVPNSRDSTSALSGYTQTATLPGARWGLSLDMPEQAWDERDRLAAFIWRLEGAKHRIALADPARPRPLGTATLGGVTLASNAAQFAETLQLAGLGAGATLLRNDWIVLGGQRLRVVADATANGSGVATVEVRHGLRAAQLAGAAVTLDAPTSLFILAGEPPALGWDANARAPALTLELIEVFA